MRNKPEINIKPCCINLKLLAKLVFMPKEDIERIILSNLEFDGKKKRFILDITKAIDMMRD